MESANLEPGTVERRMIAYFLEGIKRNIYDWASLKLGRDSPEAETFKDEVRKIMIAIRKICYLQVKAKLDGQVRQLRGAELIDIIHYVLPPNEAKGPFWTKLSELIDFAFGNDDAEGVVTFMRSRINAYIDTRLPRFRTHYEEEWEGAVKHIKSNRKSTYYCINVAGRGTTPVFEHFYKSETAVRDLCSDGTVPLHKVRLSQTVEETGYWGWWRKVDGEIIFIYCSKELVSLCFPEGAAAAERAHQGHLIRVAIEDLGEINVKEVANE